jgi:hypothetical protein
MERSRLRRCTGWRYAFLGPILEEIEREGRIRGAIGKHGGLNRLENDWHKILISMALK